MKIDEYYQSAALYRREKTLFAHLLKPHRVLSTCRCHGGMREDIEYIYNHQSCEPSNHLDTDLREVAVKNPERYHRRICSKAGLPAERSLGLGTAANMNNASVAKLAYEGFEAIAICTAGVGGNGGRAGDPASYFQGPQGIVSLGQPTPVAGTINFIILLSETLTPGAMVSAATLVAEAKASVLQELSAASRYSEGIATGTGTDQLALACLLDAKVCHSDANKHSKAGELIALAARQSMQQALNLQSGMTSDSRRSCMVHLRRVGETQEAFTRSVAASLGPKLGPLFESNFLAVNHDPMTVAAVMACVHIRDQIAWGVLPQSCARELMIGHAVGIASCVAGRPLESEAACASLANVGLGTDAPRFLEAIRWAFAYGFGQKWIRRFED